MLQLIFIISLVSCQQLTKDGLQNIFGSKKCIQGVLFEFTLQMLILFAKFITGSLSNIPIGEDNLLRVQDAKTNYKNLMINITKLEQIKNEDKSILSKLNEFAQYNDLDYYYKLENEEVNRFIYQLSSEFRPVNLLFRVLHMTECLQCL